MEENNLDLSLKQDTHLFTREGYHLDASHTSEKDYEFPLRESLKYENSIIGFIHNPKGWKGMNVIMSDGTKS